MSGELEALLLAIGESQRTGGIREAESGLEDWTLVSPLPPFLSEMCGQRPSLLCRAPAQEHEGENALVEQVNPSFL